MAILSKKVPITRLICKGEIGVLENVSIIIPFQTDHGPREEAFEWIKKYYYRVMPQAELCIGLLNEKGINKSKAINLAAKKASRDIFVVADADIIYDPKIIVEAIKLLDQAPWVVPFTEIYNIEKPEVNRLLKTKPRWPIDIKQKECTKANWLYEGFAGKLFVIPRANFEAAGGFDERFIGWGGEDDAFSHAVQTICGKFVSVKGEIYHLWHPASSYQTNPHGQANGNLLNRYRSASGNDEEMMELISERNSLLEDISLEFIESPKNIICFAILVHDNRELVKQLIDNIRYYCPNSIMMLYNGGEDPTLCDGLGVPVCPSSRKLERGWTTVYFLETMEWLEKQGIEYNYFINIDSDALFIRKGYEEFIQNEMKDTDYMAVKLRIPEEDWYIGNELKKDIHRWEKLFNLHPFYGIFNVGQVISRPLVKALLELEKKEKLKAALSETVSFGSDEFFFVNLAKELGFKMKKYPNETDEEMIRYRPFFTLEEMIHYLTATPNTWLCHPVIRDQQDPVRKFILHLGRKHYTKRYKNKKYPWYQQDSKRYDVSLPLISQIGSSELIVRSGSSLAHYWKDSRGKWQKSATFAEGVTGHPLFFENISGDFGVICKLTTGGVGVWWRDNHAPEYPWYGPSAILDVDADPVMATQLQDGRIILVFESKNGFFYLENDNKVWYKVTVIAN